MNHDDPRLPDPSRRLRARELALDALVVAGVPLALVTLVRAETTLGIAACMAALALLTAQACLLFHDALHGALFRRDRFNRVVGRAIGAFYFWPFAFLRDQHLAHHRRAGLLEGDTELVHAPRGVAESRRGGALLAKLARTPLAPLAYAPLMQALNLLEWLSPSRAAIARSRRARLGLDVAAMVAMWTGIDAWLVHEHALFRGFFCGMLAPGLAALALIYLASKPLHTHMSAYSLRGASPMARALMTSRSFESHAWARLVLANLNYHVEHHLHPKVRRWQLRALSLRLRGELASEAEALGVSFQLHPSYLRWYLEHRTIASTYNPNVALARLRASNARFSTLRPPA
jgi:omega-6 fatty acid desaturase (delta-12 desaturase)